MSLTPITPRGWQSALRILGRLEDAGGTEVADHNDAERVAYEYFDLHEALSSMKRERDEARAWADDRTNTLLRVQGERDAALEQVKVARELVERATFQHQAECEEYQGTGECNCVYEKAKAFLATLDGATLSKGGKG